MSFDNDWWADHYVKRTRRHEVEREQAEWMAKIHRNNAIWTGIGWIGTILIGGAIGLGVIGVGSAIFALVLK